MSKVKKYLFIASALTLFSVFSQEVQGEVWSNTVGYQTIQLQEGRNFVGLNFKNPEGDSYNVQELLDTSVLEGGLNRSSSDQLIVWDTINQKYIRLWLRSDGIWIDTNTGRAADRVIPAGAAFWVIKQTSEELTETKPF